MELTFFVAKVNHWARPFPAWHPWDSRKAGKERRSVKTKWQDQLCQWNMAVSWSSGEATSSEAELQKTEGPWAPKEIYDKCRSTERDTRAGLENVVMQTLTKVAEMLSPRALAAFAEESALVPAKMAHSHLWLQFSGPNPLSASEGTTQACAHVHTGNLSYT